MLGLYTRTVGRFLGCFMVRFYKRNPINRLGDAPGHVIRKIDFIYLPHVVGGLSGSTVLLEVLQRRSLSMRPC